MNNLKISFFGLALVFSSNLLADNSCFEPRAFETKEIEKIGNEVESQALLKCVHELYDHKSVPKDSKGKYWHDINGTKTFAKQCWKLDNYGEKEIIYTFLNEGGIRVLKFPVFHYKEGINETSLPRNIMRFEADGKSYLLSQFDNVGEYFDSLKEENLTKFVKDNRILGNPVTMKKKYIDGYQAYLSKNKLSTPALKKASENTVSHEDAVSCIKDRLLDYVSIIWTKESPEALPYINTMNADLKRSDRKADDIQARYTYSPQEIKERMIKDLFSEDSPCKAVIHERELSEVFDKNYKSRVEHYNNLRRYFRGSP